VSNAIYVGPAGQFPLFLGRGPGGDREAHLRQPDRTAGLLTQRVVRAMVQRGAGNRHPDHVGVAGMSDPPGSGRRGAAGRRRMACSKGRHPPPGPASLALEVGPSGVRVLNLEPGFVATERTKAKTEYDWIASKGKRTGSDRCGGGLDACVSPTTSCPNGSTVRGAKGRPRARRVKALPLSAVSGALGAGCGQDHARQPTSGSAAMRATTVINHRPVRPRWATGAVAVASTRGPAGRRQVNPAKFNHPQGQRVLPR